MPRTGRHDLYPTPPPLTVPLTKDQCRCVLAAICDVVRRERESVAELRSTRNIAVTEALRDKVAFAEECEAAGDAIRAALGDRRNGN